MKNWVLVLASILGLAAVGAAGYYGYASSRPQETPIPEAPPTVIAEVCDVRQTVDAPGRLVNTRTVSLEMPVTGKLEEVFVRRGDRVEAGQELARVAGGEKFEAQATSAELDVLQAQHELDELLANADLAAAEAQLALAEAQQAFEKAQKERTRLDYPRYSDDIVVEKARAEYALAKDRVKKAQKTYNRFDQRKENDPQRAAAITELFAAKQERDMALARLNWYLLQAPESEIDEAEAQLALAEAQLREAEARWQDLKDGPTSLDVALAEARLADAKAQAAEAQAVLEQLALKAPFDGVILEVNANPGETLSENAPLFVIQDPQALEVETSVIEEDLPYLQAGQTVDLFFDALPGAEVSAEIDRILPVRTGSERPLYSVFLHMDSIPEGLLEGMTADASVVIASAEGVLCLPRSLVRASSGGKAQVDVWDGQATAKRTLDVGLRGDTNVEIVAGLQVGEQVVAR